MRKRQQDKHGCWCSFGSCWNRNCCFRRHKGDTVHFTSAIAEHFFRSTMKRTVESGNKQQRNNKWKASKKQQEHRTSFWKELSQNQHWQETWQSSLSSKPWRCKNHHLIWESVDESQWQQDSNQTSSSLKKQLRKGNRVMIIEGFDTKKKRTKMRMRMTAACFEQPFC